MARAETVAWPDRAVPGRRSTRRKRRCRPCSARRCTHRGLKPRRGRDVRALPREAALWLSALLYAAISARTFGPQHVDRGQALVGADVPVGPAVAGRLRLHHGAHLVDRAGELAHRQAAVGAHPGACARPWGTRRCRPGCSRPASTIWPNGTRGSDPSEPMTSRSAGATGVTLAIRASGQGGVARLALDADEAGGPAAWPPRRWCRRRRTGRGSRRPAWWRRGSPGAAAPRASASDGPWRRPRPCTRSSPVASGSVQSERICSSSLAIFMAS